MAVPITFVLIKLFEFTQLSGTKVLPAKWITISHFGKLLHETWMQKKELSRSISNNKIDQLYNKFIKNGALGGKLLGAGGGGFLLLYIKNDKKDFFLKKFKNIINIPFKFSNIGCEVILNSLDK